MDEPHVALCHEWLTTYGGSEQVAQRLARVLNARDVFVFAARPDLARELFPGHRVRIHPLGNSRLGREHWQRLLPIMPYAWSHLRLDGFDVVVTSSHSCVNAIRPSDGTLHISYCHTPMRYAWEWRSELGRVPIALRPLWPATAAAFRRADRRWAQRVTRFIANSAHVAGRIRDHYGRDADVVHPPIDTDAWTPDPATEREDHFLVAGRLVAYKRVEIALAAAEEAGVHLVVAGDGPELGRLRRLAGPNTRFVVHPSTPELLRLYRSSRALLNPGVEDFGMTMVEAQACATPVIALGVGGAREIVRDGDTGLLYEDPSSAGLAEALRRFPSERFDRAAVRAQAERFDARRFDEGIRRVVEAAMHGSHGASAADRLDDGPQHDPEVQ